jgi:hypothetical protein
MNKGMHGCQFIKPMLIGSRNRFRGNRGHGTLLEFGSAGGGGVFYSWDGRMGSVPRAGLRGTRPALAGKLAGGTAFALGARDGVDRPQCLLRSGPAAARVA